MFRFENPQILYTLIGVLIIIVLYIISFTYKKRALKKFGDISVITPLMPDVSFFRPKLKFTFIVLALIFIIIALAKPQFGSKLQEVKREGVEIIIALDVSNSMLAEDIKPNRLERSKRAIAKLIDKLKNDKIGLIVFAGDAYTQLPITTDYAAAKMFLESVNTGFVQKQGTAIGSAIELAMKSFSPDNDKEKALIIISDGENHEDDAVEVAKQALEKNIKVYTIGMGLPQGAPIPIMTKYGQRGFRKDKSGNVVVTKLDEKTLQQIAVAGEGMYIRANNSKTGLKTLFNKINKMEKQKLKTKVYSAYDEKFQYFAAIALFLLIVEFLILERKNKYFKNVNIFKVK
ncbi:MAG: VWA domain-containing protein [Chlorobi bacterium]|nr:VWA domain-containing protein [Chlorobiota bacterium]